MSIKEKTSGKESNNKKAHRHYSLLLLALLFIGFATYGTYAYFTSSTSTNKGHLTLNGTTGSYNFGTTNPSSGDGLASSGEHQYTDATPDSSGNVGGGNFDNNAAAKDYSKEIAEFDWVYTGNSNSTVATLDASKPTALGSFNNAVVSSTIDGGGRQFDNVTGGDVFRKTVRLAVSSTKSEDTTPANLVIEWDGTGTYSLDNLSTKKIFVKKGSVNDDGLVDINKTIIDVNDVDSQDLTKDMKIASTIKPGEYVEIDLLVQVNNNASITGTEVKLAELARQIKVTVSQDTAIKSMPSSPAAQAN